MTVAYLTVSKSIFSTVRVHWQGAPTAEMFATLSRPIRAWEVRLLCLPAPVPGFLRLTSLWPRVLCTYSFLLSERQRDEVFLLIGDKAEEATASQTPRRSVDGDPVLRWHFPRSHRQEAPAANTWAQTIGSWVREEFAWKAWDSTRHHACGLTPGSLDQDFFSCCEWLKIKESMKSSQLVHIVDTHKGTGPTARNSSYQLVKLSFYISFGCLG